MTQNEEQPEIEAEAGCGPGCGCIWCGTGDLVCPKCGSIIGGGCPDSSEEEVASYRSRHPEEE